MYRTLFASACFLFLAGAGFSCPPLENASLTKTVAVGCKGKLTTHVVLRGKLHVDLTEILRPFNVSRFVNVDGQNYYLHFGKNSNLANLAGKLTGGPVTVTGTLEQHGRWMIVHVSDLNKGSA